MDVAVEDVVGVESSEQHKVPDSDGRTVFFFFFVFFTFSPFYILSSNAVELSKIEKLQSAGD